jgi:hypothetical protein
MKRFWMHVMGGVMATAGLAVVAPACTHDDSSFFLDAVLAPPQGSASGCVYTNDPTQAAFSWGIVDVEAESAFSNAYYAEFLVGNQIIPTGNQEQVMDETSRIIIKGAVVTITAADGTPISGGTSTYTTLGAGEVDPSASDTPGYGLVNLEILDPTTITALKNSLGPFERETVITYTKAFGTTLGGDSVESNTFEFPILACRGCLINFDTALGVTPQPNCEGKAVTMAGGETPCFYGQDVAFDCHACSLTDPFCLCAQESCSLVGNPDAGTTPDAGGGGGGGGG